MIDNEIARSLRRLADEIHDLARKLEALERKRQIDYDADTDPDVTSRQDDDEG